MSMLNFDQIVVTGCSFSTGMEMNDELLPAYKNERERQLLIWQWAKENLNIRFENVEQLQYISTKKWEEKELDMSWPAMLEKKTNIPVTNLSIIASSIGRSLLTFSNYIKNYNGKQKKILAVHQLPNYERMYLRLNNIYGRINVIPSDLEKNNNFGFHKNYFKQDIIKIRQQYKSKILGNNFFHRYTNSILKRLEKLSVKRNITNYYILPEKNKLIDLPKNKFIIEDFSAFRSKYPKGKLGHPIGYDYNNDLCNEIISTCC